MTQALCPSPVLHLATLDDAEEVVQKVDLLLRNYGIVAEFVVLEPEGSPPTVEMKWRPSEPWAERWLERAKEHVTTFVFERGWDVTFDLFGARFEKMRWGVPPRAPGGSVVHDPHSLVEQLALFVGQSNA